MITGFIAENLMHKLFMPREDSYSFNESNGLVSIAVADGITRDPEELLPDVTTLKGKARFALLYRLRQETTLGKSHATETADMFTSEFTYSPEKASKRAVKEKFEQANQKIKEYNAKNFPAPDYVLNDLAGCTASGALIQGRECFYGFICDSGFAVFNDKGDLILKERDKMIDAGENIPGFSWLDSERRAYFRKHFRNAPKNSVNGNLVSYGALTGESEAMRYVKTGHHDLKERELVMVYTDGLEELMELGEFRDELRQGLAKRNFSRLKRFCKRKVKSEGTAAIYVPEELK